MTNTQILKEVKKYFGLHELVDKATLKKYGQSAWQFLDMQTLHCLLIVRTGIGRPIKVNTKSMQQRGLRTNKSPMVVKKRGIYLSAHCLGKAYDFGVKGMTANEVRKWIVLNKDLFPCKIRLERKMNGKYISWVHLDSYYLEGNPSVYLFDV